MTVSRKIIDKMNSRLSDTPPESGGIIGSENDGIIDKIIFDKPISEEIQYCYYSPNVDFLNKHISIWSDEDIQFMGVFHTHFANVKSLSAADKNYIEAIMMNMPDAIDFLYFPIFVFPVRELIVYKAEKSSSRVTISLDDLLIV